MDGLRPRRSFLRFAAVAGFAVVGAVGLALGDAPATSAGPTERSVLFIRGADRSGGFLEAASLDARTEHLSDVNNLKTNSGNHGWGELAAVLRSNGFTVTQITEVAEASGVTEGRPADLSGLDQYDLIVFGSNNAVYAVADVATVDSYVRRGGAVLFISDANFGGSWQDAPNSDQQFLDSYGIIVHQDTGTYKIDDEDFVRPSHPVLGGVSGFDGEGVSPFDVSDVNDDVGLTVLALAEGSVRRNAGDRQGETRPSTDTDAASWVATVGAGRIAGHFDRNTFFNDKGAGTNIGRYENTAYAINLFAWLTGGEPVTPPPALPPPTNTTPNPDLASGSPLMSAVRVAFTG